MILIVNIGMTENRVNLLHSSLEAGHDTKSIVYTSKTSQTPEHLPEPAYRQHQPYHLFADPNLPSESFYKAKFQIPESIFVSSTFYLTLQIILLIPLYLLITFPVHCFFPLKNLQ